MGEGLEKKLIKSILNAAMIALCSVAFIVSRSAVFAQSPSISEFAKTADHQAVSSISILNDGHGGATVVTTNRSYAFYYDLAAIGTVQRDQFALIEKTTTSTETIGDDGSNDQVSINAWIGGDVLPTVPTWTVKQPGNDGSEYDDFFYRITQPFFIDMAPVYTFYNLRNGNKLYQSSAPDLFSIDVPNSNPGLFRWVSFTSASSVDPPIETKKLDGCSGILMYGSQSQIQTRVLIRDNGVDSDADSGFPKIYGICAVKKYDSSLDIWHPQGQGDAELSNFKLIVSFGTRANIIFPFVHDKIDWAHVIRPKGLVLTQI